MEKTTKTSDEPVIQIDNLVKEYKSSDGTIIRAVNNVSMSVAAGEIVGLLARMELGKQQHFVLSQPSYSQHLVTHRSVIMTASPTPLAYGSHWAMYPLPPVYLIVLRHVNYSPLLDVFMASKKTLSETVWNGLLRHFLR